MINLRPVVENDADSLFPLIYRSAITDTLIWDGPESLEELRGGLRDRAEQTRRGTLHAFTIVRTVDSVPIGMIAISPDHANFAGDTGIWIGAPYQGCGYGTEAIRLLVEIAFGELGLHRLEGRVFVGNTASRRAFEKNGFIVEGTLRQAVRKRGRFLDEWLLARVHEN